MVSADFHLQNSEMWYYVFKSCLKGSQYASYERGAVILLAESRKSTKKVPENRKKSRKFGRKPENAILESRKIEKKSAKNRKTHIFVAENRKETPYYPPS